MRSWYRAGITCAAVRPPVPDQVMHYRLHSLPRARRVMLARSASLLGAGRRNMHAENAAFDLQTAVPEGVV